MQLTSYTDYSLRALLFIAKEPDRLVTVSEISDHYGVSRNHMVKVIHNLGMLGFIKTVRGKSGGVRLALAPEDIKISDVVKQTEPHLNIQECFNKETNTCPLIDDCRLMGVLYKARSSFMSVLEQYTLADMLKSKPDQST
jgi:Rrf2 family nitric oxide-sensitive transcriptional repressor